MRLRTIPFSIALVPSALWWRLIGSGQGNSPRVKAWLASLNAKASGLALAARIKTWAGHFQPFASRGRYPFRCLAHAAGFSTSFWNMRATSSVLRMLNTRNRHQMRLNCLSRAWLARWLVEACPLAFDRIRSLRQSMVGQLRRSNTSAISGSIQRLLTPSAPAHCKSWDLIPKAWCEPWSFEVTHSSLALCFFRNTTRLL